MATINDLRELFIHRQPHEVAIEISGFTGFRTTLIEELTQEEIDKLYRIHSKREAGVMYEELMRKTWKSNVLTIATEQGLKEPHGWEKFNHWMLTKSRFRKHLNAHNVDELKLLHQQLCQLRDNNEKSAQKPMNRAWFRKGEQNKNWN